MSVASVGSWRGVGTPTSTSEVAECPRSFFGCLLLDSSVYRRGGSSARCLPQPQSQRDRSNARVVPLMRFGKTKVVSQHSNPVFYVLWQTTGAFAVAVLHPKTPPPKSRARPFDLVRSLSLFLRLHPFGLRRLPNVSRLPLLCGTLCTTTKAWSSHCSPRVAQRNIAKKMVAVVCCLVWCPCSSAVPRTHCDDAPRPERLS